MQAFTDYQRTRFGGWPWPEDAMVSNTESEGHFIDNFGQGVFPRQREILEEGKESDFKLSRICIASIDQLRALLIG
mgnify:CR=1 FL=1